MKKFVSALLLPFLVITVLGACGTQKPVPAGETEMNPTESSSVRTVTVHTVDELLAALGSNVEILAEPGDYLLDQASDFGKESRNDSYFWSQNNGEYELILNHVHNLTIRGTGQETTSLLTSCLIADVLSLRDCSQVTLDGFSAGHAGEAMACSGGVMHLEGCEDITIQNVGLFGCGITGVSAVGCISLNLYNTDIYDCSMYGVEAYNIQDLTMDGCRLYALGRDDYSAQCAIGLSDCENARIQNCTIAENKLLQLLTIGSCQNISFSDTEFTANRVEHCGFEFLDCSPLFDRCVFSENSMPDWYSDISNIALDENGKIVGDTPLREPAEGRELQPQETIYAGTADEFLKAIGSDREIILTSPLLDLSTAGNYGDNENTDSLFYCWKENFDGPELIIQDAENLTIRAEGQDLTQHTVCTVPRYANVLFFSGCRDLVLSGFTAGHTELPGECSGGVLYFDNCDRITVDHCGLFGCGVLGIDANSCTELSVKNCDIYDCSMGGIQLYGVNYAYVSGNTFRNLGGPDILSYLSTHVDSDVPANDYSAFYMN